MKYWRRAFYSVMRRKGKSLILFLVIFVLGNVIAGAIAIRQSTDNVEKKIKSDLGAVAVVAVDYEESMKADPLGTTEGLPAELIHKIGKSSYVVDYDYSISTWIRTVNFKPYDPNEITDYDKMSIELYGNSFTIKGTNSTTPSDFKNNVVHLVDGRFLTEKEIQEGKEVALISKHLADENRLSVGDIAVIDSHVNKEDDPENFELVPAEDFSVEIVGLYEPAYEKTIQSSGSAEGGIDGYIDTTYINMIYTSNKVVENIDSIVIEKEREASPKKFTDEDGNEIIMSNLSTPEPFYTLESPDVVEAFKSETEPLLPKFYQVRATTDEYDKVAGSINKLGTLSEYVVIASVLAALLIISLLVILFSRDRKHELGIYLSLGEKRSKVIGQIVIELAVVGIFAMGLSLVTGNFLGDKVSDSLLQSDMMASEVVEGYKEDFYYDPLAVINEDVDLSQDSVREAYEVKFTSGYVITFFIIGLLTIIGSAVFPLIYILRLNPKEIML